MAQRYRIGTGWRIAAGALGVVALAAIPIAYGEKGWWGEFIPLLCLGGAFLWAAVKGRSPAWLERLRDGDRQGSGPRDP